MPDYVYTVRNTKPLPYLVQAGPHICGVSRTLEEAIAIVKERAPEGFDFTWWEILHRDGTRWFWEPCGPHVKLVVEHNPKL